MIRKFALIYAFTIASFATTTAASANPLACYQQYDEDMDACGGSSSCEQQANISLGVCLASLVISIEPCESETC